jgi:hypothetical protein
MKSGRIFPEHNEEIDVFCKENVDVEKRKKSENLIMKKRD